MNIYVVTQTEVYEYGDCVEITVTAYLTRSAADEYVEIANSPHHIATFEIHEVELKEKFSKWNAYWKH